MVNLEGSGGIFCLELQRGQEIYNKKREQEGRGGNNDRTNEQGN